MYRDNYIYHIYKHFHKQLSTWEFSVLLFWKCYWRNKQELSRSLQLTPGEFPIPNAAMTTHSEKGWSLGNTIETIRLVFTSKQLRWYIKPRNVWRLQESMEKQTQVLTRRKMVLVALESGQDLEVTLLLYIYCILYLCLYRKTTMETLAPSMSPTHRFSERDRFTTCGNIPILCVCCIQQKSKILQVRIISVAQSPNHITTTKMFVRMWRIHTSWAREMRIFFKLCPPSSTRVDVDGLEETQDVGTSKGDTPPICEDRKAVSKYSHWNKPSIQRLPLSGVPLYIDRSVKKLAVIMCLRFRSVDFNCTP